jgi:hypothetical protein
MHTKEFPNLYSSTQNHQSEQMKEDEMGETSNTHGPEVK